MARYKYFDDDDWQSESSVDNTTDDPTYTPEGPRKRKRLAMKVGKNRSRAAPKSGRHRQKGMGDEGSQQPSTSRAVVASETSENSESDADKSDGSTPSNPHSHSNDCGSSSSSSDNMDARFQELNCRKGQKKRRDGGDLLTTMEKEPFSFGIAELPEDFGWTDRPPAARVDCFNPLRDPGSTFSGTELPVEIFLKLHEPALHLVMESINETGAELVQLKKMKTFRNVDWEELLRFHSILIFCQSVKISRWEVYWKHGSPLYQPFVASQMSFKRFKQLKRCVRCYVPSKVLEEGLADPESPNYDPLYKITPMQKVLLESYRKHRFPQRAVTIDEQMIKYKVRIDILITFVVCFANMVIYG